MQIRIRLIYIYYFRAFSSDIGIILRPGSWWGVIMGPWTLVESRDESCDTANIKGVDC
jgi:hypothetical protein